MSSSGRKIHVAYCVLLSNVFIFNTGLQYEDQAWQSSALIHMFKVSKSTPEYKTELYNCSCTFCERKPYILRLEHFLY